MIEHPQHGRPVECVVAERQPARIRDHDRLRGFRAVTGSIDDHGSYRVTVQQPRQLPIASPDVRDPSHTLCGEPVGHGRVDVVTRQKPVRGVLIGGETPRIVVVVACQRRPHVVCPALPVHGSSVPPALTPVDPFSDTVARSSGVTEFGVVAL